MNVLYIFTRDNVTGGASSVALNLIPELENRGFNPTALLPSHYGDGSLGCELRKMGVKTHAIDYREWCYVIPQSWLKHVAKRCLHPAICVKNSIAERKLINYSRQSKIDLIVTFDSTIGTGFRASHMLGIPSVGYLQSVPWKGLGRAFYSRRRVSSLCGLASRFIAISNYVRDEWLDLVGTVPTDVVYNAVIPSHVCRRLNHGRHNCVRMVVVGGIGKSKGQELVLQAADKLLKDGILGFQVYFVGVEGIYSDYQKKVYEHAQHLPLKGHIKFLPYQKNIASVWASSDVVISACEAEGFGLSIVEGMASGLLAIGPDSGGVRELLQGGNGLIYRHGNPIELAKQMAMAIETVKHDGPMIQRGRQFAEKLTITRQADEFAAALKHACNQSSEESTGYTSGPPSGFALNKPSVTD